MYQVTLLCRKRQKRNLRVKLLCFLMRSFVHCPEKKGGLSLSPAFFQLSFHHT